VAAETPLEFRLADTWGRILGVDEVSVEDDFFCDLGGHSLKAAQVVSLLRKQPGMQGLAMGDLYAHPTIRSLAQFVETDLATPDVEETSERPAPLRHSNLRVRSCGLAQFAILYTWLLLLGAPTLVLAYAVQLRLHLWVDEIPIDSGLTQLASLGLIPLAVICIAWFMLMMFLLPVVGSRLLMRGVQPGWYPLWGITYLRFWFCGKVLALSPLALLAGSPMLSSYLRLLGARVGRDCFLSSGLISLPTFIEIGDGTSIGFATRLQPQIVQDGWMRLAPIRIGSGSFIGTSSLLLAGAEVGDEASVGDQSLVHADHRIPSNEHWAGSPIKRLKTIPDLLETMAARADDRRWPISVLIGFITGGLLLRLLPWLVTTPSVLLEVYVTMRAGLGWGIAAMLLAAPLLVLVTCLALILAKRAVLPTVQPGIYSVRSGLGLRQWLSSHLVQMTVTMLNTVYCTLYVVPFLRRLGARLGRWSEVATPAFLDPDMMVIGDQTFLAGGVVMGPAVYHRGCVAMAPAEMGKRSFLGNEAVLPGGHRMSDNSLLGVFSISPNRQIAAETTWLGSPAIFLPRREVSKNFPAKLIDAPSPGLIAGRLVIEFFRIILPAVILGTSALLTFYAMVKLTAVMPDLAVLALLPALGLGLGLVSTLVVVLLKWLIMGRYRPRTEPYWGLWVRGTEFVTGVFDGVAVRSLLRNLTGTPMISPVLRLFGTHIGRRVWLNTTTLTEFDLVEIGDDAMVGEGADPQTHLFEDRVMKMSLVKIGARASVGARSVVLYDAEVGPGASLDAFSLVMKGEVLPAESRWRGIPARPL
jgi:non-ribosomal peptide synthetase-like protein